MGTTITVIQIESGESGLTPDDVTLLEQSLTRHGGRIAARWKRGLSAMFTSASDAVRCGVEVQQVRSLFRIGSTSGDVTDLDRGITDDIAAAAERYCSIATPGQIVISDVVRALCGGANGLTFEPIGDTNAFRVRWRSAIDDGSITVAVADDAPLIRSGVVRLLGDSGFTVTAEVGDAAALIASVEARTPALVVTDIRMPPTFRDEGLRAAAEIRSAHPEVAVLVLSQYIEADAAAELLDGRPAGIGYLLKERVSDLDEFVAACRHIAAGGSIVDPLVAEQLLRGDRNRELTDRLTERERDVLGLMAQGRSNAAIAEELFLGAKTVESHVGAIFRKLDLEETPDGNRRVQAVLRWLRAPGGD